MLFPNLSHGMISEGFMSYTCEENTSKNYRPFEWKFNVKFSQDSFNGKHTFYSSGLKRELERIFSGYIDNYKLYISSSMQDVVPQKKENSVNEIMNNIGYAIDFEIMSTKDKNYKQLLIEGVQSNEGGRVCVLKLIN